jgi:hypothetical protein
MMGAIADLVSINASYLIPLLAFGAVGAYAHSDSDTGDEQGVATTNLLALPPSADPSSSVSVSPSSSSAAAAAGADQR